MWNIFDRLFRKKKDMNLKCYDIVVEVNSAQGGKKRERRDGVQAPNEQMLRMMYSQTGENIVEILGVRDGDEIRDLSGNPRPDQQNQVSADQIPPTPKPVQVSQPRPPMAPPAEKPQNTQAKYYKIGDIDIKEQGGKIYQKQWVALDMNEVSNYRVVSDASNKIISMSGKHIEMKKWVAVSSNTDEEQPTEKGVELING